jgi:hypothetical protein
MLGALARIMALDGELLPDWYSPRSAGDPAP